MDTKRASGINVHAQSWNSLAQIGPEISQKSKNLFLNNNMYIIVLFNSLMKFKKLIIWLEFKVIFRPAHRMGKIHWCRKQIFIFVVVVYLLNGRGSRTNVRTMNMNLATELLMRRQNKLS